MAPTVAVQRLNDRHREDIARHLLQLPAEDRRLRFGHAISDHAIGAYVQGIDFARDRVFGIHGEALQLVGVAHLALDQADGAAELGLSVDPGCRGKGHGYALLKRALLHAANIGCRVLFMHCLAENAIMMHLARKAGLLLVLEGGEADGRLRLDRRKHGSALLEAVADQVALIDNLLKQHYLWLACSGLKMTREAGTPETAQAST
jgi:RimJ/RimL family protein N-acetyltransferase